jgi:hypothetical protein
VDGGEPPRAASPSGVVEIAPDRARAADDSAAVLERARSYFSDLLAARVREVVDQSELPFFLEGRKINTAEELFQEWTRNLGPKRVDLLKLYGIEVLTPAEMESKYGPPPARLGSFPWNSAHSYIAIGNLSGRAAIVLFRRGRSGWRAVAYHD